MTDKEKLDTIRAEIERRIAKRRSEIEKYCGSLIDKEKLQENLELLSLIDSLEEPKKCMYTNEHYTDEDRKVLCEDCEEKCEYSKKEEPVSEKDKLNALSDGKQHLGWLDDANALEESINKELDSFIMEHGPMATLEKCAAHFAEWGKKHSNLSVSDDLEEAAWLYYDKNRLPIPPEWDLHEELIDFFKAGAKWQKEQMMKDAVEATICLPYENNYGGYTQLVDTTRFLPYGDNMKLIVIKEG